MGLSEKVKVTMPESGIITRRSGTYHYVYKVISTYRDEKGQPTNKRISIGRLDKKSGMLVPNDNYWLHYGESTIEVLPEYNSVRSIGAVFAVTEILKTLGVTAMLYSVFGQTLAAKILTIVAYMTCRGNVMEHILDWCESFTLHEQIICDQQASEVFAAIEFDCRMQFFKAWIGRNNEDMYLAYDVTSLSSYAKGIEDTEWGCNRDGDRLPQINLGCYLGYDSGLPLFYVTYPGSIIDKSHMQYMMAYNSELGIDNVTFVMDKGFCSTANVHYMHSERLPYIIGAEVRNKATLSAIEQVRDSILSMDCRVRHGVYAQRVRGVFYGELSNLHIYYDPILAESHRSDLFRTVETKEEKLSQLAQLTKREANSYRSYFDIELAPDATFTFTRNYERINAAARNAGFFCLLTSTELSSAETLSHYRRKDVIEKGFDELKNHIDMKRIRTHNTKTTDGKLFCAFLALIAVSYMNKKLSSSELLITKNSLILELEKIKLITISGRRFLNPLTKTQRLILESFGLSEDDLNSYAVRR